MINDSHKPFKKKIIFFAHSVSFAHLTRSLKCIECIDCNQYEIYLATSSNFDKFIPKENVRSIEINCIDPILFSTIVDKAAPIYSYEKYSEHIDEDLKIIDQIKPDMVFGDFRHSLSVSCRIKKIKYINITNAYWSPRIKLRLPIPEAPIIRLLGLDFYKVFFDYFTPFFTKFNLFLMAVKLRHLTKLAGLKFFDYRDIINDGDVTLFCETPQMVPLKMLASNEFFIGPVTWTSESQLPDWWEKLDENKSKVFISLGSSGNLSILPLLISTISKMDWQVIVALSGRSVKIDIHKNLFVADYLPLEKILNVSSIVICNGGSPMTHLAFSYGKPVVGIVSNNDQLLNMIHVENRKAGVMLRYWNLTETSILEAFNKVINQEIFTNSAKAIQNEFLTINLRKNLSDLIEKEIL